MDIPRSTFYDWYGRYKEQGFAGLMPRIDPDRRQWNQIPENEREEVVKEYDSYFANLAQEVGAKF